jgi:hypothetical protein
MLRIPQLVSRIRGAAGLALAQMRHDRSNMVLVILGIALPVVLVVLLVTLGNGAIEAGSSGIQWIDQDLWISGGHFPSILEQLGAFGIR